MKKNNRKRFLKGSSLIEVLVAVVIIVIAITAIVKIIIIGGRASRSAHHSSEALIIAQKWIEKSKQTRFEDNLGLPWIKENDQPEYVGRPRYLSWTYWVQREERYVVLEQEPDPITDTPYTIRPFRDSNPVDGLDDFTGQEKDLKQIIVMVGWAENKLVEYANDLDTGDATWRREVFWKEVELKMLMAKPSPGEGSCCDLPGLGAPIVIDTSTGNTFDPDLQSVEACTGVNIRIRVEDLCPISDLHVVLYYIGANESDTQSVTMERMGSLGYYEASIPAEYVKNFDGACEATEPDHNTDLKFKVIATDNYIGADCPIGTTRTSGSAWVSFDVRDTSVPLIENFSNPRVVLPAAGLACDGKIFANIYDGCNGVNGINMGNLVVEIAPMDENGLYDEGDLFEIPLTSQSGDTFTWIIDEVHIQDYSNPDTSPAAPLDDLPDIYYRITVSDSCDQYTVVWSSMTVTPDDTFAPELEKIDSISSCMPWGSTIVFGFLVSDECAVASAGLYIRNRGLSNTKTIPLSYASPGLPNSTPHIYVELTPADIDSPDDLIVQFWAEDGSNQRMVSEEFTFYFEDAVAWDIDNISSVATHGASNDTVAIIIKNMRSEPTYLSSLELVNPSRIDIYNAAMGNTYTAIPYIDKVVIESLTDTTSGVLWDWETSDPTPGSRERAPVTIDFFNANIEARKLEPFERAVIRIHFVDALNDNPIPANPIDINNLHFEMYLVGDANFEYECRSLFDFVTVGNSCPYAYAGWDQISCQTAGWHPMKVGALYNFWGGNSFDPEGDPITLTWDFGDGYTSSETWPSHIFTSTGLHLVTLEVSDGFCSSYDSIYVKVSDNEPPVARMWSYPNPTGVGTPVNFSAGSSDDPNCETISFGLTCHWDFGDGDTSTNPWDSHTYANTGVYTVTLTVTDSDSATDSISTEIEILDASTCFLTNIDARPKWPTTYEGFVNEQMDFDGWVGDGVSPYIYNWDFGDGGTASTEDAFHTYNSTGTFEVRFSVIDSSGCIGAWSFYVSVYDVSHMVCDFAFACTGDREYGNLNDIFVNTGFVHLESDVTGGFPGYSIEWNIANANPNWYRDSTVSNVQFLAYGDNDIVMHARDSTWANTCSITKQAHVSAIEPIATKSFTDSTTMMISLQVLGAPINISNVYLEGYDIPGGVKINQVYLNGTLIYLGNAATMLNIPTAQLLNLGENIIIIYVSADFNSTSYFKVQFTSDNPCGGTAAFEAP